MSSSDFYRGKAIIHTGLFVFAAMAFATAGCSTSSEVTIPLEEASGSPPPRSTGELDVTPAPTATVAATFVGRTTDLPTRLPLAADDWPQFRGALRDGISRGEQLADSWPEGGPPVLWQVAVGPGYAAPSVVGDRAFLDDYDEPNRQWLVRCFSLTTGDELWRYKVAKRIRPNHAITRAQAATDGGFVVAIDPKCEVHCLDARDGSLIWKASLPEVYGSQIPPWYNGQCPLIDDDRLVLAPCGRVLMTALELTNGTPLWETPNTDGATLSHASITPVEIDGVRQYVYLTLKGALGVDAGEGKLLWQFPWQFNTAVPTSALPLAGGKLLLTSAYHARTVVCQVKRNGDAWSVEEVISLPPPTAGWNSEVHTPIVHRGFIFGVGKKQRGLWTCLDTNGRELWTSARKASFGLGGYILADGKFYVVEGDTGVVHMLDAAADEYQELGRVAVLDGPEAWAPPVIAHGKLLVRDLDTLVCMDISETATGATVGQIPDDARRR
jgi:outer membrane protein assembly factor BamB